MGWERRDRHRLGRLPGVLDGPRLGRRGDQAPARAPHVDDPLDRGGGRPLPLLPRRRRALHGARDLDGGPGGARLGHRARLRRVHARSTSSATTPRARWSAPTAGSTAAWPGTASTARRASCSTGSSRAASTRTCARGRPPTWPGPASRASRSAARSASRRSRCARWSAGRCATCPTSRRATCSGSATWTTWCTRSAPASTRFDCATPDAPRPPRHRARARPGQPLAARPRPRPATAPAPSRSTSAAPARPAASTRAPTCTTWSGPAS